MKKNTFRFHYLAATAAAVLILGATAVPVGADDDGDDEEIPFDVATVYFELNDTDGDLGFHALIDGEPWKTLEIETPNGRENMKIRLRSKLRRQGLTELFFESAEPTFDELDPEIFFDRFPEGEYEVEGRTIEGDEMESTSIVTHLVPAAAENLSVNGVPLPEDCDEGPVPEFSEPFLVRWDAVTHSHAELGRTDEPIEVVKYELVLEREEPTPLKISIDLPPDVTSLELPSGLANPGDEMKIEVLVRETSGNQTAVESCFDVE
jgi:hypothetical protein